VLAAAKKAGIEKDYQIEVLPEAKSLGDILREGLAGGETSLPLGLKVDGMEAVVRALPAEVRGEVQGAMRMMGVLQREGMVIVGPGLVESTR
jgi:hypothetical protein